MAHDLIEAMKHGYVKAVAEGDPEPFKAIARVVLEAMREWENPVDGFGYYKFPSAELDAFAKEHLNK